MASSLYNLLGKYYNSTRTHSKVPCSIQLCFPRLMIVHRKGNDLCIVCIGYIFHDQYSGISKLDSPQEVSVVSQHYENH